MLEGVFITLLVLSALAISWISGLVVLRLFKGQS
jgi:hypothetical protein